MYRSLAFSLVATLCFLGCDSDDPDGPVDTSRDFTVTVENVGMMHPVLKSGGVASPGGPDDGPAIFPGESASFTFTAPANTLPMSGMRLNFATMFVQSNDLFYAFPPEGLALYDGSGNAVTGDVTDELFLYDAGTEVNEVPGVGANQKPRQPGPDTGPEENGSVAFIPDGGTDTEGHSYPAKENVIRVELDHDGDTAFTITVTNVSDGGTLALPDGGSVAVPLSPFAYAVHVEGYELYELGAPASRGIEWIAEDGFPADMLGGMDLPPDADEPGLLDMLMPETGLTVPLSPGAYAVHDADFMMFETGAAASIGIERIAEDGDAAPAGMMLADADGVSASGVFNTPEGMSAPGPLPPGGRYTFSFSAAPGDRMNLATMYAQSNDLYYAFAPSGLELFPSGSAVDGDVTGSLALYDAGTEGDEEPGVGPFQVIRQPSANTGPDGEGSVVSIGNGGSNDGYSYPPVADNIRVTISSN